MTPTTEGFRQRSTQLMRICRRLGDERYHEATGLVVRLELPPVKADYRRGYDVAQSSVWYANALAHLIANGRYADPERDRTRLQTLVGRVLDHQVTDTDSGECGNFRWYLHWDGVRDRNAVSFIVPELGQLLLYHGELFAPELTDRARAALALARRGLDLHPARWNYTNIWLLNILSRITIAAVIDDAETAARARRDWDAWFRETDRTGIPEYNSPAYTAVNLVTLGRLHALAPDEGMRSQIEAVLVRAYRDLALHWHAPSWQLAGAHGRASALNDIGISLASMLMHQQIGGPEPAMDHAGAGFVALNPWEAPEELKQLARDPKPNRCVRGAIPDRGIRRVCFLRPRYALGAKGGPSYGPTETLIHLSLAAPLHPALYFKLEDGESVSQQVTVNENTLLAAWNVDQPPAARGRAFVWIRGCLGPLRNLVGLTVDGEAWNATHKLAVTPGGRVDFRAPLCRPEDIHSGEEVGIFDWLPISLRFAVAAPDGERHPAAGGWLWYDRTRDRVLVDLLAHDRAVMVMALAVGEATQQDVEPTLTEGLAVWAAAPEALLVDLSRPPTADGAALLECEGWSWRPGELTAGEQG